ncbi:hypothetical protein, partial [Segetibacter aerophilus]|uniref:hypothetical protein n=1 Tax=Segetibacter aerophilus TaxID=670293 RepID=UPI0011BDD6C9
MEAEIIQTVLTEVVEDFQELKQQNAKLVAVVSDLNNKVDDFQLKLSNIQVSAPVTDIEPMTRAVNEGVLRLPSIIEKQPKSIIRQHRILLFPEHGTR